MNAEELIERLKKSFQTPSTKDERLKVVLVCIIISTTFWFFSALNKDDYVSQINYPIEIIYDNEAFVATAPLPSKLPIDVTGGGWDLMTRFFGFSMNTLQIEVENPAAQKAVLTSSIRSEITADLDPVLINFIPQDSIKFQIQRRVEKKIPVIVTLENVSLDDNYRMGNALTKSPDSILLIGAEDRLKEINQIILSPEISGVDRDVTQSMSIPDLPEFVNAQTESVELSFDIIRYLRVTETYPIEKINFPREDLSLTPAELNVNFSISELEFDVSDSTEIKLLADFETFDPADSTVAVEAIPNSSQIDRINFTPLRVKVELND